MPRMGFSDISKLPSTLTAVMRAYDLAAASEKPSAWNAACHWSHGVTSTCTGRRNALANADATSDEV